MSRDLDMEVKTRIAPREHRWLMMRAASHDLRPSEYLRWLILADLQQKTEDRLLQAVEAEHTRLTLLAPSRADHLLRSYSAN
jgi:hypothetical protein